MAVSQKHRGWRYDKDKARLSAYADGTEAIRTTSSATNLMGGGTLGLATSTTSVGAVLPFTQKRVITTLGSTAGYTMTAAQLLGGVIVDTVAAGAGVAATLPTVADVVLALGASYAAGSSWLFYYKNPGNQTVTLTTNTGWTLAGLATIATTKSSLFLVIINSASAATFLTLISAIAY